VDAPRHAIAGGMTALLGLTLLILLGTVLADYRNGAGAVSFLLLASACATVVWLASMAEQAHIGRVEAMIEALGDASFSTYLFHLFVLAQMGKLLKLMPFLPGWVHICLCVVISNLVGLAIYRLLERPMTNRLRRLVIPA
jgi:exopolysaccharide production protein ExoZ